MFTRTVAIHVSRPLDEVFSFVEDARNRPRWDESVETEELTSPEPIGVGTTVRTHLRRSLGQEYGPLRLLQPVIARIIQRNLDRGFPRLKRLLETGAAS